MKIKMTEEVTYQIIKDEDTMGYNIYIFGSYYTSDLGYANSDKAEKAAKKHIQRLTFNK